MEIVKLLLDVMMIGLLGAGIYFAIRLERQLKALRESRTDMARYTQEFARDVGRAELSIKNLKQISRETGDDLEKLLGQGRAMRDELQFVIDRADTLSAKVSMVPTRAAVEAIPAALRTVASTTAPTNTPTETGAPKSRAERELLQALQKINGGGA
jgi:hypothetical protein